MKYFKKIRRAVFNFYYFRWKAPIYLDTSALRAIPKKKPLPKRVFFTSSLTYLELLTHFTRSKIEKDFNILKSILNFVRVNSIETDWRITEEIFHSVFPSISLKEVKTGDLRRILGVVDKAENMAEFWQLIKAEGLHSDIHSAEKYDTFLGKAFNDPSRIREFRTLIEKSLKSSGGFKVIYDDLDETKANELFKRLSSSDIETGICFILKSYLKDREKKGINPLQGYKGEVELYLHSSANHFFTKVLTKANYKRNDMIDLFHLLYVNPGSKILSKENIIKAYVLKYQPLSFEYSYKYGF